MASDKPEKLTEKILVRIFVHVLLMHRGPEYWTNPIFQWLKNDWTLFNPVLIP
jgi:hypothetical protein